MEGGSHMRQQARQKRMVERLERRLMLAVDVLNWHYDSAHLGANTAETVLTTSNVNSSTFGKLATFPVDGQVYAQPLLKTGVNIPGVGVRDVLFVATEHDSLYAFDANGNGQSYLWKVSFLTGPAGTTVTTVPNADVQTTDITPEIGITGTPAIDGSTSTLYVVVKTKETTNGVTRYVQRLHALDLATGTEKMGGPVEITGSVPGTGDGSSTVTFNPLRQNQRSGLLLANGNVYIAWGSHGDQGVYHGWVMAYNASNIQQQTGIFCSTPDGSMAGIWMAGGAPSVDGSGNIYVGSGNGSFNANTGGRNYGDAAIELTPSLGVSDWFVPWNQSTLSANDQDFGTSSLMILPPQSGSYPDQVVASDKTGRIYLLNRDNMGHFNGTTNQDLSEVTIGGTLHKSMAFFNQTIYVAGEGATMKAFPVSSGVISPFSSQTSKVWGGNDSAEGGGVPTVSANGTSNGIVWVADDNAYGSSGPAVLYAYSASNLGTELWDSSQAGARDTASGAIKFTTPVVANGHVFLGGNGSVTMWGLLPPPPAGVTQVVLPYNQVGIQGDGVTFSSANSLDLQGNSFSGNLLGSSQTWNTVPFNIGAAGVNDAVQGGTNVVITLPSGQYTNLEFLATATNGNFPSQTFTVTYSDGTNQTFTQGISDWYTPQNYVGESTAVTMAYRNMGTGAKDNRTFYAFGYSLTLNSAKTVTSLTLPGNANVKVLAVDLLGSSTVTLPAAPTSVAASAAGSSQINVSWQAPTGPVSSYNLYRSTTPGGEGSTPYRTGITTTSFSDTGLMANTTYYYRVSAVNSAGEGALSSEVNQTTAVASSVVQVALPYNQVGLRADSSMFNDASSLDGVGYALSGNLLGSSQTWNGNSFALGPVGVNDVVRGGTGVTVSLPAGQYGTLQMLALCTNGNQPNQVFTVTYTDATTQMFTFSMSDWHTPQSYTGESNAITMPYRNAGNGTRNTSTFYIYGYSLSLNSAKTVQSLTLPANTSVKLIAADLVAAGPVVIPPAPTALGASAVGTQINLGWTAPSGPVSSYNIYRGTSAGGEGMTPYRNGITTTSFSDTGLTPGNTYYYEVSAVNSAGEGALSNEAHATASTSTTVQVPITFNQIGIRADGSTFSNATSLDLSGASLSGTLMGSSQTWNGSTFTIGPAGANDVLQGGASVVVNLPAGQYHTLEFLALAVNGNQPSQTFTIRYTDGTTQTITQGISDWFTPQSYTGESKAVTMAYRDLANGTRDSRTFYLYGYSVALNPAKTVQSIQLPNNVSVKVLAIDLVT
jgi:fibronectin type 3 domain-containing protein